MKCPDGFVEGGAHCGYIPPIGCYVVKKEGERPGGLLLGVTNWGRRLVFDPMASYEVEAGVFVVSIKEGVVALVA